MSDTNQKVIIVLAALLLLIVLFFGWPTPYRYVVLHRSIGCGDGGCTVLVRISRITGNAQWNDGQHGWLPAATPAATPAPDPWEQLVPKKVPE
ncbi:MAG: hypothetical protein ACLQMT_12150 [Candidatus Acidiferrales bacterium]